MTNRIMWRIDDNDTVVIFPENGTVGVSQGRNQEGRFDIYNAETDRRKNLPSNIKKVKTEGKLIFHGSLAQMFAYSKADEIDLSGFDTSNVTDMFAMFACSKTREIDLTSFIISDKTDTFFMFHDTPNATVLVNEETAKFIQEDN